MIKFLKNDSARVKNMYILLSVFLFLHTTGGTFASPEEINRSYALESGYDYFGAMQILDRMSVENPKSYFIQLRAGWLSYLASQYSKSAEYYQKAAALKPESIESRTGMMLPLMALGKYKQAEVVAFAVLKIDQNNYLAKSRLAYSLYMSGEYKQSEKYYDEIVTQYPSDTTMLIGLGWSLWKQGKKDLAHKAFLQASEILPGNKTVEEGLYLTRGDKR